MPSSAVNTACSVDCDGCDCTRYTIPAAPSAMYAAEELASNAAAAGRWTAPRFAGAAVEVVDQTVQPLLPRAANRTVSAFESAASSFHSAASIEERSQRVSTFGTVPKPDSQVRVPAFCESDTARVESADQTHAAGTSAKSMDTALPLRSGNQARCPSRSTSDERPLGVRLAHSTLDCTAGPAYAEPGMPTIVRMLRVTWS